MDNVVNMEERLAQKRQKLQLEKRQGRIGAIQKLIQCSSCLFRCALCGQHLGESDCSSKTPPAPYGLVFCNDCGAEFEEFLAISRGEKPPEVSWHNEEWVKMWSTWLDYRRTINGFVGSPEFKSLLDELNR
jgi:hypothetical protein